MKKKNSGAVKVGVYETNGSETMEKVTFKLSALHCCVASVLLIVCFATSGLAKPHTHTQTKWTTGKKSSTWNSHSYLGRSIYADMNNTITLMNSCEENEMRSVCYRNKYTNIHNTHINFGSKRRHT